MRHSWVVGLGSLPSPPRRRAGAAPHPEIGHAGCSPPGTGGDVLALFGPEPANRGWDVGKKVFLDLRKEGVLHGIQLPWRGVGG